MFIARQYVSKLLVLMDNLLILVLLLKGEQQPIVIAFCTGNHQRHRVMCAAAAVIVPLLCACYAFVVRLLCGRG